MESKIANDSQNPDSPDTNQRDETGFGNREENENIGPPGNVTMAMFR